MAELNVPWNNGSNWDRADRKARMAGKRVMADRLRRKMPSLVRELRDELEHHLFEHLKNPNVDANIKMFNRVLMVLNDLIETEAPDRVPAWFRPVNDWVDEHGHAIQHEAERRGVTVAQWMAGSLACELEIDAQQPQDEIDDDKRIAELVDQQWEGQLPAGLDPNAPDWEPPAPDKPDFNYWQDQYEKLANHLANDEAGRRLLNSFGESSEQPPDPA